MNGEALVLLLATTCLSVAGQTHLKLGMLRIAAQRIEGPVAILGRAAASPRIWLGTGCHLLAVTMWLLVLSRLDLSLAYPFGGMTHVGVVLVSWLWLGETVPPRRWLGVALIGVGILAVMRS